MNKYLAHRGVAKVGIVILALMLTAIATASAQTISVGNLSIQVSESGTVGVVLDEVPTSGLSYANITVTIGNNSVAEITEIKFPSWATLNYNSTLPSSELWFKVGDLNDQVKAGDENVVLANLTVKGVSEGESTITVTVISFQDDSYEEIKDQIMAEQGIVTVSITEAVLTITVSPLEVTMGLTPTQVFTAIAKDQYDNPVEGISIIWTSSNETVGTVSPTTSTTGPDGTATTTFTALATGTTTIKAESNTVSGTALVTVEYTPWLYDEDSNEEIDYDEAVDAVQAYYNNEITKDQVLEVIKLYFG